MSETKGFDGFASEHGTITVSEELLVAVHDALVEIFDREPLHWVETKLGPLKRLSAVLDQARAERRREAGERESWDRSDLRTL